MEDVKISVVDVKKELPTSDLHERVMFNVVCSSKHTDRVIIKVVKANLRHFMSSAGISQYPVNNGEIRIGILEAIFLKPADLIDLIDVIEKPRRCNQKHCEANAYQYLYDMEGDQMSSACITFNGEMWEDRNSTFHSRCKITDINHNVLLDIEIEH